MTPGSFGAFEPERTNLDTQLENQESRCSEINLFHDPDQRRSAASIYTSEREKYALQSIFTFLHDHGKSPK